MREKYIPYSVRMRQETSNQEEAKRKLQEANDNYRAQLVQKAQSSLGKILLYNEKIYVELFRPATAIDRFLKKQVQPWSVPYTYNKPGGDWAYRNMVEGVVLSNACVRHEPFNDGEGTQVMGYNRREYDLLITVDERIWGNPTKVNASTMMVPENYAMRAHELSVDSLQNIINFSRN